MPPHSNHVEMRASRRPARQYVSETHDRKPDARWRSDVTLAKCMVLRKILDNGPLDLTGMGEWYRQRCIELAMEEPPLVDVDGSQVFLTKEGEAFAARDKADSIARQRGGKL
ncbi:hypothetical protein [Afipia carboxidovorans]|uniref:hypothetical protein n=1 Tax=Afipia carboxidovorans TaxID=40137 RepID=UPI003093DD48|nr:hypothetical protein CRBSH125_09100 [Afipia carboxidovorans]